MFSAYFPGISPIVFALVTGILGWFTPGYDHLRHTVSRLAIEQYGWIQSLNLIQLAYAVYLTGNRLIQTVSTANDRRTMRILFTAPALLAMLAALIPTDPVEGNPLHSPLWTPTGLTHVGLVFSFLILSPLGIYRLIQILTRDTRYRTYAIFTAVSGYTVFAASITWVAWFTMGILPDYRGLFQKAIICVVLFWLVFINAVITRQNTRT